MWGEEREDKETKRAPRGRTRSKAARGDGTWRHMERRRSERKDKKSEGNERKGTKIEGRERGCRAKEGKERAGKK